MNPSPSNNEQIEMSSPRKRGSGFIKDLEIPASAGMTDSYPSFNIDAELEKFEAEERKKMGLDCKENDVAAQWKDTVNRNFYADQRAHTTILVSGLTYAHDNFVKAGLAGIGYNIHALDCPDNAALQFGKEYGNRGQCNPTYFTVGNLVKHLVNLRDKEGMSPQDIIEKYIFLTAGGCGPCRFGMYVTEYRKALRDAGFEGFRVMIFDPNGGVEKAVGREAGLKLDKVFFTVLAKALFAGDALNAIMYRIRPYEVVPGSTDKAIADCREIVMESLRSKTSLLKALYKCRKILKTIEVDRTLVKPKVSIIGEFWAMTTEGEGNYHLQRFLEQEGAEVDIQLIANYVLYNVWQARFDTRTRMGLRALDADARKGLKTTEIAKRRLLLWAADKGIRVVFHLFGKILGLKNYHLPNMDENAMLASKHYNNELRGGEGHMEVGKLIQSVIHNKAHMIISVKPFGCMPSSGVSDGVQSVIIERYPEAIFLPIETTGDGAVNVYSRVQMMLFKAKRAAEKEYTELLAQKGLTVAQVKNKLEKNRRLKSAIHYSPHKKAGTAANFLYEAA